jgi:hypothetical protein
MVTFPSARVVGKTARRKHRDAAVSTPVNGLRCLRIATPVVCDLYWLRCIPVAWGGRGFSLEKADGTDTYCVLLDGARSTCECLGFLRWGHCKHVEALAALVEGGAL